MSKKITVSGQVGKVFANSCATLTSFSNLDPRAVRRECLGIFFQVQQNPGLFQKMPDYLVIALFPFLCFEENFPKEKKDWAEIAPFVIINQRASALIDKLDGATLTLCANTCFLLQNEERVGRITREICSGDLFSEAVAAENEEEDYE